MIKKVGRPNIRKAMTITLYMPSTIIKKLDELTDNRSQYFTDYINIEWEKKQEESKEEIKKDIKENEGIDLD